MLEPFITTVNSENSYTEIVRGKLNGRYIVPVFRVFKSGKNSFEEASKIFFEHNSLPIDEVVVTTVPPENVVFQHIEVPPVRNVKNIMGVANFKAASQFSLPPDEVRIACLNDLKNSKQNIIPAFVITKKQFIEQFLNDFNSVGFPKPDILSVKPFSIFKIIHNQTFTGNSIVYVVDYDFSILMAMKGEELVGINYVNEGFSELIQSMEADEFPSFRELEKSFISGNGLVFKDVIGEMAEKLQGNLNYQIRMYITNTLSNSPNTIAAEESMFNNFFVLGQSHLSTAVYTETFKRLFDEDITVLPAPVKVAESLNISYTAAGLLIRGGELLGKRKLVVKEETEN